MNFMGVTIKMKIVCLAENTSSFDYIGAEHGLSLFIETSKRLILFDFGQSRLFSANAEKLGVDLSEIDIAILSHGHYDHGGGLEEFLRINKKAPVYLSSYAFEPHYNGTEKYIGLDTSLAECKRLHFVGDEMKIGEGLTLYSCNEKDKHIELGSFGLNTFEDGIFVPDDFRHEQYLLIEDGGKKVLISGCSHKGILNIAKWFEADVIIGGFHFSKLPLDDKLEGYAKYLNEFETEYFTCHCTGEPQFEFMKKHMKRLHYLSAGESIIL